MDLLIIAQVKGGLGNQMFQYAATRALSHTENIAFKLDVNWFKKQNSRPYQLNLFNTKEDFATDYDISKVIPPKNNRLKYLGYQIKKRFYPPHKNNIITPGNFCHLPKILQRYSVVYLNGYWQSERYFAAVRDIIREDFVFKSIPNQENSRLINQIRAVNSVNVHIRRGDYIGHKTHNNLGLEYYYDGLKIISEKVSNPHLFVFSDDIMWAKENFRTELPVVFIDNNLKNNEEDLRLMTNCKHHIVANSSFSWWGAWLSEHPGKTVIAPKAWFTEKAMRKRITTDIIPEEWIKI